MGNFKKGRMSKDERERAHEKTPARMDAGTEFICRELVDGLLILAATDPEFRSVLCARPKICVHLTNAAARLYAASFEEVREKYFPGLIAINESEGGK
jgi:hypothetical protein